MNIIRNTSTADTLHNWHWPIRFIWFGHIHWTTNDGMPTNLHQSGYCISKRSPSLNLKINQLLKFLPISWLLATHSAVRSVYFWCDSTQQGQFATYCRNSSCLALIFADLQHLQNLQLKKSQQDCRLNHKSHGDRTCMDRKRIAGWVQLHYFQTFIWSGSATVDP
jgi:hypothetical protein